MEQTAVKKVKRGVATARGTQRLKFSHEHAAPNGLFVGHLEDVRVSEITIGESTSGMPSFNGLTIPKLIITFASNDSEESARKYTTLAFNAVESNVETCAGGSKEWRVNVIFDWMKHLLNVYYLKGREMTEEEANLLTLDFDDTDDDGNYNAVDVKEVIDGYTKLFNNFANLMNTAKDEKPVYKTVDGKFIPVWIKLIRYVKGKKGSWTAVNNGELSFPTFVGEGCVEIYRQNVKPALRLDAVHETIMPKEDTDIKAKNPNILGTFAGGDNAPFDPMAGIAAEAATDMPF